MAQRDVAAHLADLEPVSRRGTVHGSGGVAAMSGPAWNFACCETPEMLERFPCNGNAALRHLFHHGGYTAPKPRKRSRTKRNAK